jgi:hypothetical protein
MATTQKRTPPAPARTTRTAPPPAEAGAPTAGMIAARAYEIWQANGCVPGRDAENWYQAEQELRARFAR